MAPYAAPTPSYTDSTEKCIFLDTPTKSGKSDSYLPLYSTPSPPPPPSAEEEEQEERRSGKIARIILVVFLLFTMWNVGRRAGLLPPDGGTAVDLRIRWNIQGVPQALKDQGVVPWWKVAIVALKVDVDVTAGRSQVQLLETAAEDDSLESERLIEGPELEQQWNDEREQSRMPQQIKE